MKRKHPYAPVPVLHVVWPEHAPSSLERDSSLVCPASADKLAALHAGNDTIPCKWEERFDICEMQAILHMLEHLSKGLPGAVRRMLLRRADQFPKLHGSFAPFHGELGFHAEEGEVIGMGHCWREGPNGDLEQLY